MRKKETLLGMSHGKANNILRKKILFRLICNLNINRCYQCKDKIVSVNDLSIEHKVPWESSIDPIISFFDLGNIAFSHLKCNINARIHKNRNSGIITCIHGHSFLPENTWMEKNGNRHCKECNKIKMRNRRKKLKDEKASMVKSANT